MNPRSYGVELRAGTQQFFADLDAAARRWKQYGRDAAASVHPIADGFRSLAREGQAATASAGAAMGALSEKSLSFFRALSEAPQKIAIGFRSVSSAIEESGKKLHAIDQDAKSIGEEIKKRFEAIAAIGAAVAGVGTAVGKALAGGATVVGEAAGHSSALDTLLNVARTARLVLSPTIFTATAIAVGALVEEIGKLTVAQAEANEQAAVMAKQYKIALDEDGNLTDQSIEKTQQLSAVVKRLGGDFPTFLQAFSTFQGAHPEAGLPEFGQQLQRLGDIRDPVERVNATFQAFGNDVGRQMLPYLDERFAVNAQRVTDWGVSLDRTARENIDTFRKDMHDFALGFKEDVDLVALAAHKLGLEVESGFAKAYVGLREGFQIGGVITGSLLAKIDEFTSKYVPAGGLFGPEKVDLAGLARQMLGVSSHDFGSNMLQGASPTGNAISAVLKDELKVREQSRLQGILDQDLPLLFPQTDEERKAAKDLSPDQLALLRQQALSAKQQLDALKTPKPESSDPFARTIHEDDAAIAGLKEKLAAIGTPEAGRVIAEGFAEAQKQIARVNDELKALHNPKHLKLTASEEAEITQKNTQRAALEAETSWQSKFSEGTVQIANRVRSLELLTAAIGQGYEATRNANVETKLMEEFGRNYGDKAWLAQTNPATGQSHQQELDARRLQLLNEEKAALENKGKQAVLDLNLQIALEEKLAAAQAQGAEAVRQATLDARIERLRLAPGGATEEQIQKERELSDSQRTTAQAAALATTNERIQATQRMTAAILQSVAAEREAAIQNKIAGAEKAPGASQAELEAIRTEEQALYSQELARTSVETDRVRQLDDQIAKLQDAKALHGDTLAIEIQLRDLENQRIEALVQESLGLRGARDGLRAFFLEMQKDSESAAQILYDSLNSALDRLSQSAAKALTGQKAEWGKTFQQLGEQMAQESIKSALHQGLGQLGKLFGVDIGHGKPDGSADNPFYVRIFGAANGQREAIGTIDRAIQGINGPISSPGSSIPGVPGGVFQGSSGSPVFSLLDKNSGLLGLLAAKGITRAIRGRALNSAPDVTMGDLSDLGIFGGAMASGGDFEPGKVYWTGEHGPEPFIPGTSGHMFPAGSKLGGDTHIHYEIDARGSQLGVENRIRQGIESSHDSAVATAVQASHEHRLRTPGNRH